MLLIDEPLDQLFAGKIGRLLNRDGREIPYSIIQGKDRACGYWKVFSLLTMIPAHNPEGVKEEALASVMLPSQ